MSDNLRDVQAHVVNHNRIRMFDSLIKRKMQTNLQMYLYK